MALEEGLEPLPPQGPEVRPQPLRDRSHLLLLSYSSHRDIGNGCSGRDSSNMTAFVVTIRQLTDAVLAVCVM